MTTRTRPPADAGSPAGPQSTDDDPHGERPRTRTPLVGLLAGHAVSLTGNMLTLIALPLYVLAETGSAAATGLAGFFATLPVVVGGALGGVVVDRIGYRRASVWADVVSGVTIAAVPLLAATVGLPFWLLLALVFGSGLLDTPGQTARTVLLPEAAQAAGVPLERALGLFQATERGSRLVGAPLAGLLVALVGPLPVLAADAATFAVSAVLVARLVPGWLQARPPSSPPSSGYWADLRDGLRFTVREPLLRAVVLLVLVTNLFDAAKASVLLPVWVEREGAGAPAFGLLVGAMGGGALIGSLVFGAIGHRLPRRPTFVVAFTLAGGPPFLALAAGFPLPVLLGIATVAGLGAGAINPIIGAVELERVPAAMRARVFGLVGAGAWAAMPVGALGAGVAVEQVGLTPTLVVLGVAYLAVSLVPLCGGVWRGLDRPAAPSTAPEVLAGHAPRP